MPWASSHSDAAARIATAASTSSSCNRRNDIGVSGADELLRLLLGIASNHQRQYKADDAHHEAADERGLEAADVKSEPRGVGDRAGQPEHGRVEHEEEQPERHD